MNFDRFFDSKYQAQTIFAAESDNEFMPYIRK